MHADIRHLRRMLLFAFACILATKLTPAIAQPYVTPGSDKPLMAVVQTRIISNDGSRATDYAIRVGDTVYPAPPLSDGTATGFQILLLDRGTLALVSNQSVPTTLASGGRFSLYNAVRHLPSCGESGCIVVVQSLRFIGWTPGCDSNSFPCAVNFSSPGRAINDKVRGYRYRREAGN